MHVTVIVPLLSNAHLCVNSFMFDYTLHVITEEWLKLSRFTALRGLIFKPCRPIGAIVFLDFYLLLLTNGSFVIFCRVP